VVSPAERDRLAGEVACRVRAAEWLRAGALTAQTIEPEWATWAGWALLVAAGRFLDVLALDGVRERAA
jgi:hypothetical protein